jgi:hypothetical protein
MLCQVPSRKKVLSSGKFFRQETTDMSLVYFIPDFFRRFSEYNHRFDFYSLLRYVICGIDYDFDKQGL